MITIYDWQTLPEFLAFALLPDARIISAQTDDDAARVLTAIDTDTSWLLFHLNCTETSQFPSSRDSVVSTLHARGIRTLNAYVTDISKRTVQARCARLGLPTTRASRDGEPHEQLIVKTNSNYGGEIEREMPEATRQKLGLAPPSATITRAGDYPVMSREEIPEPWWDDASLVFERFITNREDRWYRAYVLLSRLVISEMTNPAAVKKVGRSAMTQQWYFSAGDGDDAAARVDCPPALLDAVHRVRVDARLDFGAIDVMMSDEGIPYVIDINSTPAYYFPVPGLIEHLSAALMHAGSR